MKTVSYPANDPDFLAAMHEVDDFLKEPEARFLLLSAPVPRPPVLTPFSIPVLDSVSDPDNRADVLARIRILKTVKPGLRVVLLDGVLVGKIAQCPWGPGWMASSTRSRVFWSMDDAALALIEAVSP